MSCEYQHSKTPLYNVCAKAARRQNTIVLNNDSVCTTVETYRLFLSYSQRSTVQALMNTSIAVLASVLLDRGADPDIQDDVSLNFLVKIVVVKLQSSSKGQRLYTCAVITEISIRRNCWFGVAPARPLQTRLNVLVGLQKSFDLFYFRLVIRR